MGSSIAHTSRALHLALLIIGIHWGGYPLMATPLTADARSIDTEAFFISSETSSIDRGGVYIDFVYVDSGEGLDTVFGEVALRFQHRDQDEVFSFRVTTPPQTHSKVILLGRAQMRGHLTSYSSALNKWKSQGREVTAFPLNLSPRLTKKLFNEIKRFIAEPRKLSPFDPLKENGTLQLRDVLDSVLGGSLYLASKSVDKQARRTYRNDIRRALTHHVTLSLISEFFMSSTIDQPQSIWVLSYRPETLVRLLSQVYVGAHPLLGQPRVIHQRSTPNPTDGTSMKVALGLLLTSFLLALFGLALWFKLLPTPSTPHLILCALSITSATLGIFGWWLTLRSSLPDVRSHWSLLLFSPLDIWISSSYLWKSHTLFSIAQFYVLMRLLCTLVSVGTMVILFDLSINLSPLSIFIGGVICSLCALKRA